MLRRLATPQLRVTAALTQAISRCSSTTTPNTTDSKSAAATKAAPAENVIPDSPVNPDPTSKMPFPSRSIDQAIREIDPCMEHPATGPPTTDPNDICIQWREHWDLPTRRPFYHNLVTNKTQWEIPPGFPTRFQHYYAQLLVENPQEAAKMGVIEGKDFGVSKEGTVVRKLSIKEQIYNYGPVGFICYGFYHFGMLWFIFGLMYMGLDVSRLAAMVGYKMDEGKKAHGTAATFLLAIAVNKLFVPVQVALTLWTAPRAAPYLRKAWISFMM